MRGICLLLCVAVIGLHAKELVSPQSVVGVVSLPYSDAACHLGPNKVPANATSCFNFYYSQWLEQSGIRIVPMPYNLPAAEIDKRMSMLNGLLFTGGDLILNTTTRYYEQSLYIFNKAKQLNDNGEYFPLWFTCQGFQMLSAMVANSTLIIERGFKGVEGAIIPLDFTPIVFNSKMFKNVPFQVFQDLANKNTTVNLHSFGVTPDTYATNHGLRTMMDVLSTNRDINGWEFVSTVEAKKYPFFGVQWHPERPQFDHGLSEKFHNRPAIAVSQWAANFFAGHVAKSSHTFGTQENLNQYLLFEHTPVNDGNAHVVFFFEYPNEQL